MSITKQERKQQELVVAFSVRRGLGETHNKGQKAGIATEGSEVDDGETITVGQSMVSTELHQDLHQGQVTLDASLVKHGLAPLVDTPVEIHVLRVFLEERLDLTEVTDTHQTEELLLQ